MTVLVESLNDLRCKEPLVLAIGTFDGVHRGHQFLLQRARERAREHGCAFGIVSFDPVPALVLRPDLRDYQITGRDVKVQLLAALEPDLLAIIPFTPALARYSAAEFVDALESGLTISELWMGDDFRFGHDREGGVTYLLERARQAEFDVHVVARQGAGAHVPGVSSSAIRTALHDGNVSLANEMLGRYFELSGCVVHGQKRGRALGYPTANVELAAGQIVPGAAVYAALADIANERYAAAVSVGTNPHFNGTETTVEAYLLDFDRDIYGQVLRIRFVQQLRGQAQFAGLDALVAQIAADVEQTRGTIEPLLHAEGSGAPGA